MVSQLLFTVSVVFLVFFAARLIERWQRFSRGMDRARNARKARAAGDTAGERLVRCATCGVHVPISGGGCQREGCPVAAAG